MSSPSSSGGERPAEKLLSLDAIRGGAALIVFTGHYFRDFAPDFERSANGTVFYAAFNDPAAVILFFVLSGFVLSRRPLLTGKASDALITAIKRWSRLAGPVVVQRAERSILPLPDQLVAASEKSLPITDCRSRSISCICSSYAQDVHPDGGAGPRSGWFSHFILQPRWCCFW